MGQAYPGHYLLGSANCVCFTYNSSVARTLWILHIVCRCVCSCECIYEHTLYSSTSLATSILPLIFPSSSLASVLNPACTCVMDFKLLTLSV